MPSSGKVMVDKRATRRAWMKILLWGALAVPLLLFGYSRLNYPKDTTPTGVYLRIVKAVNQGEPEAFFSYTEEAAQHACFTIRDYRAQALRAAEEHYPEPEYAKLQAQYGPFARAAGGPEVFALIVKEQGWMAQLRTDVSGIARVEEMGPRATIETVKGTRYAFRKRPNGIWGMTAFTPTLVSEAERAARDLEQVKKAAADYRRVKAIDSKRGDSAPLVEKPAP